jgi:tetratricopeptide (TPR) repeat protein
LDYFTSRKINRQVLIEKIPYFILSLFFGLMAILASRASAPDAGKQTYDLLTRLMGISGDIIFYLGKLIYPVKLSALYPYYDNIKNNPLYLFSLAMFMAIAIGIFVFSRYSKKIIFGAGFFLLTIFPAVQFLPQPDMLTADHYVYLPCIGIFYLLAQGGLWLYQRKMSYWRLIRVILVSVMAAVVVFLGCLSWKRSQVWKDSLTLWDDTLKNYPQVVKAYVNRGEFFLEKGQYAKAGSDFMIALNLDRNCYEAYFNLAVLSNILGNYDEGVDFVKKALKINPVFWKAHNLLAVLYGKAGKPALVIDVCRNLIELDPDSVEAYVNLCGAYGNLGDYQQAIAYGRKAVALDPYAASAQINLAVAYYYTKQYDLAIWHCNQAVRLGYPVSQEFLKALDDVR